MRIDSREKQSSSVILRTPHLYEPVFSPAKDVTVGEYTLYPRRLPCEEQVVDVAKITGLTSTRDYVYSGVGEDTAQAFEALTRGERVAHDNAGRVAKRTVADGREPKRMAARRPLTVDLAYVLGWYAGDGSCGTRFFQFSLQDTDDKTDLVSAIKREFDIDCGGGPSDEHCVSVTASDVIATKLVKGLVPGTARVKRVPLQVMNAPIAVKIEFLRGLFDADGHINDRQAHLATSSDGMSYDVWRIMIDLGCIATVSSHSTPDSVLKDGRVIKGGVHYSVVSSGPSRDRLVGLWECGKAPDVTSAGKSGFFFGDYFAARVHGVEEIEEDTYIDFKVADDASFCTPGIATKNCIALEHSVPLRILFPEPGSQDPLSRIALGSFKGFMEQNIKYWRRDKNAIITAPLPVGVRVIGGDQGSYQTIQARQFVVDEIIGAMMVTKGFVMGNEQWSAASVSQRILENSFLNYLRRLDQCLQWVAEEVRSYLRLPECGLAMKPFKKVDDVQMVQLIIQMAREKRVSWNEALSRVDLDAAEQLKQIESESEGYLRIMIQELIGQAEAGAKSAVIQAQGQSEAEGAQAVLASQQQKALPGGPPQQGQDTGASVTPAGAPGKQPQQGEQQPEAYPEPEVKNQQVAMDPQIDSWAQELLKLPPEKMKEMIGRMATQNPELGKAVAERASALRGMAMGGGENVSIDEMLSQAKSPDELVARMQLMDPKVQLQALRAIQQRNPGLGLKVMQAMAKANQQQAGMAPGGSDGVDMRPQPEQRPPRRESKAV